VLVCIVPALIAPLYMSVCVCVCMCVCDVVLPCVRLPAKVAADPEKGQLVFFGYTDVGVLNTVTELWRYPSAQACVRYAHRHTLVL
jgi:hypothetical protein